MDAVNAYLKTQTDWSTDDNIRFVFDFLQSSDGPLYDYFINHRQRFIEVVGSEQVNITMKIIGQPKH
jgi:hypothetical protein